MHFRKFCPNPLASLATTAANFKLKQCSQHVPVTWLLDLRLLGYYIVGYSVCLQEMSRRLAAVPKKASSAWILLDSVSNRLKGIQEISRTHPGASWTLIFLLWVELDRL